MTIKELLDKANELYPDKGLDVFYDSEGKYTKNYGDHVGECIVREIINSYKPVLSDTVQVLSASVYLDETAKQLANLAERLYPTKHKEPK